MIPLCVPNLSGKEAEYLQECVTSTFVSSVGPFVTRFETMVASAAGASGAIATSAGTTALHAALIAVGVKQGDLVICPSMTFIASTNAISHAGATPWLMDIDPNSWTLDPNLMEQQLAAHTKWEGSELVHVATGRRVSAVLPVFTLGVPCDMDPILKVARHYNLAVVVDAAAALGATYKGRHCADLGADLTMISFNGNKTITCGGGGAIVGHDTALLQRVRHLTTTARVGTDYDHDMVGYNYRMTNLQAAVGVAQMEQLDVFVVAKRRISKVYNEAYASFSDVAKFPSPEWAESSAWFSGLVLEGFNAAERAKQLRAFLREQQIDARPFWKPMHFQVPYQDAPRSSMAVCNDLWERIVTLPCSTHLTELDQAVVCKQVCNWLSQQTTN